MEFLPPPRLTRRGRRARIDLRVEQTHALPDRGVAAHKLRAYMSEQSGRLLWSARDSGLLPVIAGERVCGACTAAEHGDDVLSTMRQFVPTSSLRLLDRAAHS